MLNRVYDKYLAAYTCVAGCPLRRRVIFGGAVRHGGQSSSLSAVRRFLQKEYAIETQ